ncbi:MAG TPA: ATP-binding protein [Terriglobia bacterium]|nr:ATP-binding protein [Terriglobia bacterium]
MNEKSHLELNLSLSSGVSGLDEILEGPRWGEAIIFHFTNPREYSSFLNPILPSLAKEGIQTHAFQLQGIGSTLTPDTEKCHCHNFHQQISHPERLSAQVCQLIRLEPPRSFFLFDDLEAIEKLPGYEQRVVELLRQVVAEIGRKQSAAYIPLSRGFLPSAEMAQVKDLIPVFVETWSLDEEVHFQILQASGRYSERLFQRYKIDRDSIKMFSVADSKQYAGALEQRTRESLELYTQKVHVESDLQRRVFELSLMNEITRSLLSTMDLEEILHRILIGVTAKEGLGFNRAFLLLVNETEQVLEGKMAIGPSNLDEALRIWGALDGRKLSISELAALGKEWQRQDAQVNKLARGIRIPLEDRAHLLIELLRLRQPEIIRPDFPSHLQSQSVLHLFEVDQVAAVPLLSRKKSLGLLLADNRITQKPIAEEELKHLETFANYAASAIEQARLHEEVRRRISENERHIRELEAMQDRLIHSKRLSTLGELASKMAHEVRTPLVSIGGFANALLKKKSNDSEDCEYLKIIVNEVRRLERIISDVLTYVSPGIPRKRIVDFRRLVDEVVMMFCLPLKEKQIDVSIRSDDSPLCRADPDQMKQVLTAIINNAIESMPECGKLAVHLGCQQSFLRISVSDTGIGIPEDKMGRLFDAFFTTKSTGSGLGLNIASQIVANHKGSIYVESKLGEGSTFYINLPLTSC